MFVDHSLVDSILNCEILVPNCFIFYHHYHIIIIIIILLILVLVLFSLSLSFVLLFITMKINIIYHIYHLSLSFTIEFHSIQFHRVSKLRRAKWFSTLLLRCCEHSPYFFEETGDIAGLLTTQLPSGNQTWHWKNSPFMDQFPSKTSIQGICRCQA